MFAHRFQQTTVMPPSRGWSQRVQPGFSSTAACVVSCVDVAQPASSSDAPMPVTAASLSNPDGPKCESM
jgi:hypothetical protein